MCTSDCTSEDLVRISHGIKPGFLWQQQQKTTKRKKKRYNKNLTWKLLCFLRNTGRDTLIIWITDLDSLLMLQRSLHLKSSNKITLLLYFIL